MRDCDEGALVWLDGHLKVLDSVFLDKGFVTLRIRSGDKRAEKRVRTWYSSVRSTATVLSTYSIVFKPSVFK